MKKKKSKLAVWALTPEGMKKASVIVDSLKDADGYGTKRLIAEYPSFSGFQHFKTCVREVFPYLL